MKHSSTSHVLSLNIQPSVSIQDKTLGFKLDFVTIDQPSLPGSFVEFFDENPVTDCHDKISKVTSILVATREAIITMSEQSKFDVATEEKGFSEAVKMAISGRYPPNMHIEVADGCGHGSLQDKPSQP